MIEFWLCFSLVEKVARVFLTNHKSEAKQSKRKSNENCFCHSSENHSNKSSCFYEIKKEGLTSPCLRITVFLFIYFFLGLVYKMKSESVVAVVSEEPMK